MRTTCAAALLLVASVVAAAQTAPAVDDAFLLVLKASAYVESFQKTFGSMVAEERYEQSIRPSPASTNRSNRSNLGETVLVSDFLLVQIPGEGWLPFRDVFERDGKKVRDREDRLAKLFLSGDAGSNSTIERARAVMNEGARYNIGNVNRNINIPTLVLTLLTPVHRARMRFELGKVDDVGRVVEFKETSQPTYISTTGGRDLPVYGRFWVDEASGTIQKTELHAVDTAVEAHITVTFQHDPAAGLVVPARMEERYRRARDPNEVHGVATYSKFRRFQVSTSESLAP